VHYPRLIPAQGALAGQRFEVVGELVRAQELADREASLPIHPYLSAEEVDRVIASVNSWSAA
jgi:dTDP-4-amino-4,6-dideoxygalactose transaminase